MQFLSTPSVRRATVWLAAADRHCAISIHALREEGDLLRVFAFPLDGLFLSTPSVRRATQDAAEAAKTATFLSTPSVRRATAHRRRGAREPSISIHALREEGDLGFMPLQTRRFISIHALREEGDGKGCRPKPPQKRFLSTPSVRRATVSVDRDRISLTISIHALREEGD